MSAFLKPGDIRRMHAHLRLLLLLTVLVRGGMFLAYPFQVWVDDNQAAQRYLIDSLLEGDLLIGSIRYNTGYPLVIAPFAAVGQHLGRLDGRFVLLAQVALSALVPFLLYDLVRRHHSRRAALAVALLALFDPHGLQWAHLHLPVWLVALCFTLSLWLIGRALQGGMPRGPLLLAGSLMGLAVLARLNVAPVVPLTALPLLAANALPWRRRLASALTFGAGCLLVLSGYALLVHYPSTGSVRPSCIGGLSLLESVQEAGILVVAGNGDASTRLLHLSALPANTTLYSSLGYAKWQNPGPWVSPAQQQAYLAQEPAENAPETFDVFAPRVLEWYLGPCESDSLLYAAAFEALGAQPLKFLQSLPNEVSHLLHRITRWHLPHVDSLELYEDSDLPFPLQRARSLQGRAYMRNPLWPTPLAIYSHTRDLLDLINFLIVPALAWALFRWRSVFSAAGALLLFWVIFLAVIDWREGRIVAPLWPLWPLLIGGMLADLWQRLSAWAGARR